MTALQTIAVVASIVILLLGLRFVVAKMWSDFNRPFFDSERARQDAEELLASKSKPPRKRAF